MDQNRSVYNQAGKGTRFCKRENKKSFEANEYIGKHKYYKRARIKLEYLIC